MKKQIFIILMFLVLAVVAFPLGSNPVHAGPATGALNAMPPAKDVAKEEVAKNVAAKGKASVNDQAKYLGKISPSERKAAAKRARQLGLYPGIAGRAVQTPEPGKAQ